jgi:tetratricopeptide (TPR) repeat protein
MARVSGVRGDRAEQRRVLERIVALPPEQLTDEGKREALLTLAEVELRTPSLGASGIATLDRALRGMTDYERAKQVLRAAIATAPVEPAVAAAFERVARVSRDENMLLEHFERMAEAPDASLESMREGIELALRSGKHARAEKLLERVRALAVAAEQKVPSWVLSDLSDCRLAQGDPQGAIRCLREAVEVAGPEELEPLARELARLASGPEGDPLVSVEAYERLRDHNPTDRTIWLPLLEVAARIGDRKRFEELAAKCLSDLTTPADRADVQKMLARFLIDAGDSRAAVPALRGVLDDDPSRSEARDLLTSIYEQQGMHEELATLLQSQFDQARDAQNLDAIADIGLRIGGLFGDKNREASLDAYRSALEWAPAHQGLLRALLDRLGTTAEPRERAEVLQQLLVAESGEAAASLAVELSTTWKSLDEPDLAQRALEIGYEKHGEHERVRDLLEASYAEREDWRKLAELFEHEAARIGGAAAVARLKNAAMFYREQLQDLPAAAASLRKALEITPDDLSLAGELARNLAAAGQHQTAIDDLSHLLEGHPERDTVRVDLLRVRAELFLDTEKLDRGVDDLEEAHAIAAAEVRPRLIEALERRKSAAFTQGDTATERTVALRLVALHDEAGRPSEARDVLAEWVEQDPSDVDSLLALSARDEQAGRHADVVVASERLIAAAQGEARISAALSLARSALAVNRPEAARAGLERVHRDHPAHPELRSQLRALYETLNERAALAEILLADAVHVESTADRVALYQRAARLYLELGDTAAALAPLGEACKLDPDDFNTQLLMIDSNIQLGRAADADNALEAAIAVHKKRRTPELAVLYQRKGRLAGKLGDGVEQIKWLNQAMEADRKSGELASELADVSMALGDHDTAMKALRLLTMMDDPHPMSRAVAFLRQAQIAQLRGDPRRAQQWARKAKSLDDGLAEVDTFLAEIGG